MNTEPVIAVSELTYTYPKTTEPAVRGMDFTVAPGEIFGFLGPSGAGKSTTQKLLIGLLRGHGGRMLVWGRDPLDWGSDYYQRIGVSFELPNHYLKLTGAENLQFFASLYDGATQDPRTLLEAVGLADAADTRVGKYSKGMQMRLTFARALLNDPELIFLDEPTSGLDPLMEATFQQVVAERIRDGATVLLSSHILSEVEALAGRVSIVRAGRVIETGTLAELRHLTRTTVAVELRDGTDRLAELPGVHDLLIDGARVRFQVEPDRLDEVFGELARRGMRSVTATPPTLEEVFLRHYRTSGTRETSVSAARVRS